MKKEPCGSLFRVFAPLGTSRLGLVDGGFDVLLGALPCFAVVGNYGVYLNHRAVLDVAPRGIGHGLHRPICAEVCGRGLVAAVFEGDIALNRIPGYIAGLSVPRCALGGRAYEALPGSRNAPLIR